MLRGGVVHRRERKENFKDAQRISGAAPIFFGEQQGAPGAIGDDRVPGNRQQQGHRPDGVTGIALPDLDCTIDERGYHYAHVDVTFDRERRLATLTVRAPRTTQPADAAAGADAAERVPRSQRLPKRQPARDRAASPSRCAW